MAQHNNVALQPLQNQSQVPPVPRQGSCGPVRPCRPTCVPSTHASTIVAPVPRSAGCSPASQASASSPTPFTSASTAAPQAKDTPLRKYALVSLKASAIIAGLVVAYVALSPAYEAVKLARWTSVKDFRDDCRSQNLSLGILSTDCEEALKYPMSPPPFFFHDLGTESLSKRKLIIHRAIVRPEEGNLVWALLLLTVSFVVLATFRYGVYRAMGHLLGCSRRNPRPHLQRAALTPSSSIHVGSPELPVTWVATSTARLTVLTSPLSTCSPLRLRHSGHSWDAFAAAKESSDWNDWTPANASSLAACNESADEQAHVLSQEQPMAFESLYDGSFHEDNVEKDEATPLRTIKSTTQELESGWLHRYRVRRQVKAEPSIMDTQLGLTLGELDILRGQNMLLAQRPHVSSNRLIVTSRSLVELTKQVSSAMHGMTGRMSKLEDTVNETNSRTILTERDADSAIKRMRDILLEIDELEAQFDQYKHVRDVVRTLRKRVERFDRLD